MNKLFQGNNLNYYDVYKLIFALIFITGNIYIFNIRHKIFSYILKHEKTGELSTVDKYKYYFFTTSYLILSSLILYCNIPTTHILENNKVHENNNIINYQNELYYLIYNNLVASWITLKFIIFDIWSLIPKSLDLIKISLVKSNEYLLQNYNNWEVFLQTCWYDKKSIIDYNVYISTIHDFFYLKTPFIYNIVKNIFYWSGLSIFKLTSIRSTLMIFATHCLNATTYILYSPIKKYESVISSGLGNLSQNFYSRFIVHLSFSYFLRKYNISDNITEYNGNNFMKFIIGFPLYFLNFIQHINHYLYERSIFGKILTPTHKIISYSFSRTLLFVSHMTGNYTGYKLSNKNFFFSIFSINTVLTYLYTEYFDFSSSLFNTIESLAIFSNIVDAISIVSNSVYFMINKASEYISFNIKDTSLVEILTGNSIS